jgi:hypothetical protein
MAGPCDDRCSVDLVYRGRWQLATREHATLTNYSPLAVRRLHGKSMTVITVATFKISQVERVLVLRRQADRGAVGRVVKLPARSSRQFRMTRSRVFALP